MMHRISRIAHRVEVRLFPDATRLPTRWIVLLTLAAMTTLLLLMDVDLNLYDEALILQGAAEIGRGAVPHRDFFSPYGPGQFWIVASLFAIFGKTMLVARLYDLAIRGGIVLACGLAGRRLGLRPTLVIAAMLAETALLQAAGYYLYPVFPSVLCALVGTLLLVRVPPSGKPRGAAAAMVAGGALTGLTAAIRYDIGFFLLAAHGATMAFLVWRARTSVLTLIGKAALYGAGVVAVFGPLAIAGWATGTLPGFIHDIVEFAPANYARMRGLPWPVPTASVLSLLPLISYAPFLVAAIGATWLYVTIRGEEGGGRLDDAAQLATAMFFLVVLFSLKGLVRLSLVHSLLALVPAILLLLFLSARMRSGRLWWGTILTGGFILSLVALTIAATLRSQVAHGLATLMPVRLAGGPTSLPCGSTPTLGIGSVDRDTLDAACYIATHSNPVDAIFVGAGRHDKLYASNAALYFVADRRAATRWYHLEPGLETRLEIQRQMIKDLRQHHVALVALDTRFDGVHEPNDSARSSGVRLLDRYIAERYTPVAQFGTIIVMRVRSPGLR